MRTPEHRAHPRAGKNFEVDLDMNYLGPGAFTVLALDPESLPDPPPAPPPYRLTPSTRRQKHKSFAIIGEPTSSSPNSRSSSPSGRVSPFKGRGFNPINSRHVSPSISPVPPEDPRTVSPRPGAVGVSSRIPKPTVGSKPRKSSSGAIFGEKVAHVNFRGLNRQSSQSLTSLEEKTACRRPPPSPRKKSKGPLAFKELSPIQGSSPEPSQSLSSPSRIPTKSKSTPPSRLASPSRERSRASSRSQSKTNVNRSRDSSPLHSTKIPVKKYEHVQPKINSFNNKPKVPPKPNIPPTSSDLSEDSESPRKKVLTRKNSINRTSSRPNLLPKTYMGNQSQNYTSDSSVSTQPVDSQKPKTLSAKTFGPKVNTKNVLNSTSVAKSSNSVAKTNDNKPSTSKTNQTPKNVNKKEPGTPSALRSAPRENEVFGDASHSEDSRKKTPVRGSVLDLTNLGLEDSIPSTLDVVSSTTTTVTKPLKIETPKLGRAQAVSPMIDGRVLSATSVSHAINKMNDTVLNTQTMIKDSGLQGRLSSAASAVVSVRSACNEKKGGIYKNSDETESGTPKGNGKPETEEDQSKAVDNNQSSNKLNESTVVTKTDGKGEDLSATAERTAKVSPNNMNMHSSITEPVRGPQNNVKMASTVPTSVNNSTNHVSNNHSNNHVTTVGLGNARAIEREVQNNMNRLLGSMDSSLGDTAINKLSANDRIREARTVIAADVKPIRITVREKPSDVEVQSGNVGPHFSIANGVNDRPGLPPSNHTPPNEPAKEEPPPNRCKRFLKSCTKVLTCNKCQSCKKAPTVQEVQEEVEKTGCFNCLSKKTAISTKREQVRINIKDENSQEKRSIWEKLKCCKRNKVGDTQSCFSIGKRKESWVERRAGSFLESEVQQKTKCCSKLGCKHFFRKMFCCCCKKKEEIPPLATRKESMISGKKKSLTPTTLPPPEDTTPKIDASLVEHGSHMKGAIPVLPVWLAWFCCFMNCIGPGTGTILSGLFCLCIGKPRFSQKDGPKPRVGSFVINLIIGFSQFFTVLFCLVGWGWSIWWGVIMVKVAKKHKKFKHLEHLEEAAARPLPLAGHQKRDTEKGRT